MTLDHASYVRHLEAESARFLAVLSERDPAAEVPTCPGWDAADLLWHLGRVQWFWGRVVGDRLQAVDGLEDPERPETHDGLVDFFADRSRHLQDALADADPAEAVYMWAPDRTVGYVARRQAHEALIHRLDAELTYGMVTPLDTTLASDGVEEALRVMFGGCPPWGTFVGSDTHVHVAATDTELVVPVVLGRFTGTDPDSGTAYDEDDISVDAADPEAAPSATVRGPAADLDAWLWHRRDDATLTVEGDLDAIGRLRTVLAQPLG
jgi:uncharacterized protein (TIGR03083 family)